MVLQSIFIQLLLLNKLQICKRDGRVIGELAPQILFQERRRSRSRAGSSRRAGSSSPTRRMSVAVANPRAHRRSRSTDAELWLDHRPTVGGPVPSPTVLQPVLRKRRSVNKLEAADVVNDKTSKYLLTTNTQDQQGEVTTKLYKGDVIPTVGGGRQVVFNDVEVLTQESPDKQDRKRSFEEFRGIEVMPFLLFGY